MYMTWDRSMEIGHPIVDAERKALLEQINNLVDAVFGTAGLGAHVKARMSRMLGRLRAVMAEMFHTEEILMQQRGFPKLEEHRREHRELLVQFDQFVRVFNTSAGASLAHAVRFLREWLDFHAENWDRPLRTWLGAAGRAVLGARDFILPDVERRTLRRLAGFDAARA